jgi:hypothetical protein
MNRYERKVIKPILDRFTPLLDAELFISEKGEELETEIHFKPHLYNNVECIYTAYYWQKETLIFELYNGEKKLALLTASKDKKLLTIKQFQLLNECNRDFPYLNRLIKTVTDFAFLNGIRDINASVHSSYDDLFYEHNFLPDNYKEKDVFIYRKITLLDTILMKPFLLLSSLYFMLLRYYLHRFNTKAINHGIKLIKTGKYYLLKDENDKEDKKNKVEVLMNEMVEVQKNNPQLNIFKQLKMKRGSLSSTDNNK